jgi:hypothetical protein
MILQRLILTNSSRKEATKKSVNRNGENYVITTSCILASKHCDTASYNAGTSP